MVIEGSVLVRDVIGFYLTRVAGFFFLIEEEGGGLRFILNPTSKKVTCLFLVRKLITCVDTTKCMTKCN